MRFPTELKYTKDHEWAKIQGKTATIGITDHAQSSLGDVVFVDLPKVGRELKKGETFGVVESIKAVSDLYSPASGKVVEVNSSLVSDSSAINKDPHGAAWLIKLEITDPSSATDLMDAASYSNLKPLQQPINNLLLLRRGRRACQQLRCRSRFDNTATDIKGKKSNTTWCCRESIQLKDAIIWVSVPKANSARTGRERHQLKRCPGRRGGGRILHIPRCYIKI
jgi:glycine cleavage system H protein